MESTNFINVSGTFSDGLFQVSSNSSISLNNVRTTGLPDSGPQGPFFLFRNADAGVPKSQFIDEVLITNCSFENWKGLSDGGFF